VPAIGWIARSNVLALSPRRVRVWHVACEEGRGSSGGAYLVTMDVQPITYRGRIVAACTRRRFVLADDLEQRPPGDPELVFVVMMCAYATDIARGVLPGPYDAADACRYARGALIPGELLERPTLDVNRAAAAVGVPADELRAARGEHAASP
jgi:hypothetical protein